MPYPVFEIAESLTLSGQTFRETLNKGEFRLCFRIGETPLSR